MAHDNGPHPDFFTPYPPGMAERASLRVRRIAPGEALDEVQRLRHEVYFLEQGRPDGHGKRIIDGLDGCGTALVVELGCKAVASLRLHDFAAPAVQVHYGDLFQVNRFAHTWPLHNVAVATRLVIRAEQRAHTVMDHLMQETYRWAQAHQVRFWLMACEPTLINALEHYGLREYLPPIVLPGGVALLRMALVIDHAPALIQHRSPLRTLVMDASAGAAANAWMRRNFADFDTAWHMS